MGWSCRRNPETVESTLQTVPIVEWGSWGWIRGIPSLSEHISMNAKEVPTVGQCLPLAVDAHGEPVGSEFLMGFEGAQGIASIVLPASQHPAGMDCCSERWSS